MSRENLRGNLSIGWASILSVVLIACIGAFGCGGGTGNESGGSVQSVSSAASEGPIAAFGSIVLNGVRWNTDRAAFEIDGRSGSQADLGVGMVVRVEGTRVSNGSANADRVVFESRLRGPIRSIEVLGPDTRALTIFGIRALVSRADTRFEGIDLDSLAEDRVVELSGFPAGENRLDATHLRDRGRVAIGMTEVKAFGSVRGLAGGSFLIGTSEVLFDDTARVDDFGPVGLREGLDVRVEGILLANDAIRANEIESPRRGRDDDFDEIEIQGVVSDLVSISDFLVAGRRVDARGARLLPNDPDLLREGVRVEVEGRFDALGVLVASKLKFRSNRVRIHASIDSDLDVDAAAGELVLLGVPIRVDGETRLRDRVSDLASFGLDDLGAGDFVEMRGIARSDGTVLATRFERERPDDLRLRGPVDVIDGAGGSLTILGVEVLTDAGTVFRDDQERILSRSEFFARVEAGWIVDAKDRSDGNEAEFDVADEVELEEAELEEDDDADDADDDDWDEDDEDDGDSDDADDD